jgi:putative methyltransferase (TIGR04325 family)
MKTLKLGLYLIHRFLRTATVFDDCVTTWGEATTKSTGYSDSIILEKVTTAFSESIASGKLIERDSVVLNLEDAEHSYPLLFALQYSANLNKNNLKVLDYGGSLGSTYRQYESFLKNFESIKWSIIEQSHFVKKGREFNFSDNLSFFETLQDCLVDNKPNLALFSSSLQYLEDPFEILNQVSESNIQILVLDRIPIYTSHPHSVSVQYVPDWIYGSRVSYPSHIFNLKDLSTLLNKNWKSISEFKSLGGDSITRTGKTVSWGGSIYLRK